MHKNNFTRNNCTRNHLTKKPEEKTATTNNNKIKEEAYSPYTDIEDQTKVTHGPKVTITTATSAMELPPPQLSEQERINNRRRLQQETPTTKEEKDVTNSICNNTNGNEQSPQLDKRTTINQVF
jgi:hypothetical protein